MNNETSYNPFKAVVIELVSPQAQEFYAAQTLQALTFALIAVTETVRLGYLFADWICEQEYKARDKKEPRSQGLLGGFEPYALLLGGDETKEQTTKDQVKLLGGAPQPKLLTQAQAPCTDLVNRMISSVDEGESSKPRPKTRRVGYTSTNIVFGIDGKTVKELRVLAKERGYKNTSKLTKRELLGLLA
jgi:hypothetical protein